MEKEEKLRKYMKALAIMMHRVECGIMPTQEILKRELTGLPHAISEVLDELILLRRNVQGRVFFSADGSPVWEAYKAYGIIIKVVCKYFKIHEDMIADPSREKCFMIPRMMVSVLVKDFMGQKASLVWIGNKMKRDHSTVINHLKKHNELLNSNKEYADKYIAVWLRCKIELLFESRLRTRHQNTDNRDYKVEKK
jgi:hypothetical protein